MTSPAAQINAVHGRPEVWPAADPAAGAAAVTSAGMPADAVIAAASAAERQICCCHFCGQWPYLHWRRRSA